VVDISAGELPLRGEDVLPAGGRRPAPAADDSGAGRRPRHRQEPGQPWVRTGFAAYAGPASGPIPSAGPTLTAGPLRTTGPIGSGTRLTPIAGRGSDGGPVGGKGGAPGAGKYGGKVGGRGGGKYGGKVGGKGGGRDLRRPASGWVTPGRAGRTFAAVLLAAATAGAASQVAPGTPAPWAGALRGIAQAAPDPGPQALARARGPLGLPLAAPPPGVTGTSPSAPDTTGPLPTTAGRTSTGSGATYGIPAIALGAYRSAADRMAQDVPGCHLSWPLLAGIGRVESDHGKYGGAVPGADGVDRPSIIGIRLDGSVPGTAVVRDTDHGALDGDPVYDHAVGPMQFLPATWSAIAVPASGHGAPDPQNVNDAALAAARYLCASGSDVSTSDGVLAALGRYNPSSGYAALVLQYARAYAAGTTPIPDPGSGGTGAGTEPAAQTVSQTSPAVNGGARGAGPGPAGQHATPAGTSGGSSRSGGRASGGTPTATGSGGAGSASGSTSTPAGPFPSATPTAPPPSAPSPSLPSLPTPSLPLPTPSLPLLGTAKP
jgi:membrane-bound lytic murein transglycosylase B